MLTTLALFVSLSAVASTVVAQTKADDVDVALVLAVDTSRSMDNEELQIQRDGYVEALRHKEFIDAVKSGLNGRIAVSYFEWAGSEAPDSVVDWEVIATEQDAIDFAHKIETRPIDTRGRTSISAAIVQGATMIASSPYRGMRDIIDISGDGANNFGEPVAPTRDKVVKDGIVINGLAMMLSPSETQADLDKYYADCVVGGPGSFVLPIHKIEDFAAAVRRKLVLEISGFAPPATTQKVLSDQPTTDCLIGEKQWQDLFDR